MTDLVVLVPSRGRPQAVAELAAACRKTCAGSTALLVVVDVDDPAVFAYQDLATPDACFSLTYAPPASGHAAAVNYGARVALGWQPFAVAKFDDDHRPRTKGWDLRYLTALRELGTGVVYGNDLYQGERLPTAPAMTTDIIRELGHMCPPVLRHLFVDDYWRDLGRGAGCLRYLPSVVVEHLHPYAGKAAWDDGYARANDQVRAHVDGQAYQRYVLQRLPADVEAVQRLRG